MTRALLAAVALGWAAGPRPVVAQHGSTAPLEVTAAQKRIAQRDQERYDDLFRKYSKRFFGVGFDWQYFKAQGMAESELNPNAKSRVGARGIMQLMPSTYELFRKHRQEMGAIDDPESNIAAGIMFDRDLYVSWKDHDDERERLRFMFGSYNAGQGTIRRAKNVARADSLDDRAWKNIEAIAPKVQRWRYKETLPYVRKIEDTHGKLRKQPRKENVVKAKEQG